MSDFRYRTGTASVAADGAAVTFSSAQMLQAAVKGDHLSINRLPSVEVVSVDGQTQLGIEPWAGATLSAVPYVLFQDSIFRATRGQVAADVSKLNASLNRSGYYYFVGDDQAEPDPSDGDEGQYAQQESTGKRWLKQNGVWVYLGIYARYSPRGAWTAGNTYATGDLVNRNGKLWLAVQAGAGHDPAISPLYWIIFLENGDVYDVASFDTDRPGSGETIVRWQAPRATMFLSGLTDSIASAQVAALAIAVFSLRKNGAQIGTLTFAAGSASGVFAAPSDTTFSRGDILTVIAPNPRDDNLSGTAATLVGFR